MAAAVAGAAREDQHATGHEPADPIVMAAAMAGAARKDQHATRHEPADLSVPDEVEEEFELCGESTPYLRSRAQREEHMAMRGKGAELISDTRRLVLGQFLRAQISQIWTGAGRAACCPKVWFDSMQLCDILAARGLDFGSGDSSHAAAVLRILWKAEDARRTLPSDFLPKLTDVLRRRGLPVQPVMPEDIDKAESRILRCLGWQVWVPSLHSWLAAFFSRFGILVKQRLPEQAKSEFEAVLTRLWLHSYACGVAVVTRVALVGPLAPRSLAMGLLGLGCVRAGLLPLHDARPEWLGAAEWEEVFVQAMGPLPTFKVDSDATKIKEIIRLATDSSQDAVRDACGRAALTVSDGPMLGAEETARSCSIPAS
jgi:hypothetical protein